MQDLQKPPKYSIPPDYYILLGICVFFILIAFILDSPGQIIRNYYLINTSRSVLVTDYIALGGIGAALVNAAVSGFFYLILLIKLKCEPHGRTIAAVFVTIGFSLFGKNMFNTLPIFFGVWIFARVNKQKLSKLLPQAMLSGTIAPLVSEIAFFNEETSWLKILIACAVGVFVGFVFPVVTESAKRMHRGYCLYNSGIAGGFISTFSVGILRSTGIEVIPMTLWDTSNTLYLASFAYILSIALICHGIIADKPKNAYKKFMHLINERDLNNNDYLEKYGSTCYINIGIMCALVTSIMLVLGIPLNGPVLGGILTVAGFSASGKHIKNALPILMGSVLATYLNHLEITAPANAIAILFSTGLAPITGKHGWKCGFIVGFMHVSVAIYIGNLNGGLNLYNNGFAEGFVAITFVPIIVFFKDIFNRHIHRHR